MRSSQEQKRQRRGGEMGDILQGRFKPKLRAVEAQEASPESVTQCLEWIKGQIAWLLKRREPGEVVFLVRAATDEVLKREEERQ